MRADSDARDRQNRPLTPYQGRLDTSVPLIAPATSGGSVTLVEVSLDMAPVEVAPSRRNMRVDVLRVHPVCSRMGGRKVGCAHAAQSEPPHLRHQTLQHLVPHGPARLYRVRSGNQSGGGGRRHERELCSSRTSVPSPGAARAADPGQAFQPTPMGALSGVVYTDSPGPRGYYVPSPVR